MHGHNDGLQHRTEVEWETLTTHGHTTRDNHINFFTPHVSAGNRMAAHLIGRWLHERGHVPLPANTPQPAASPHTNHDHATNWDGHDLGEQRDQT